MYSFKSNTILDKVTVVTSSLYLKHNRGYFRRSHLNSFSKQKKYLFFYKKKTNELGILLHKVDTFYLYNLSKVEKKPITLYAKSSNYRKIYSHLAKKGFYKTKSLQRYGYKVSVNFRKYQGEKTLLIQAYNYSKLQKVYQNAIKNYSAKSIMNIKTKLPKSLIYPYYKKYKKGTRNKKKLFQLELISQKLFNTTPTKNNEKYSTPEPKTNTIIKEVSTAEVSTAETSSIDANPSKEQEEVPIKQEKSPIMVENNVTSLEEVKEKDKAQYKSYNYYANQANINVLSIYLSSDEAKKTLSSKQYKNLSKKRKQIQEDNLLKMGNLKELIAAYTQNKNPKYKQRIMSLIKEEKKE
jgi:hypothetical protein